MKSERRRTGLKFRYLKDSASRRGLSLFLSIAMAGLVLCASITLLGCSPGSDDTRSYYDCGILRIPDDGGYGLVSNDEFYQEKGFSAYLAAFNSLVSSGPEMDSPIFLVSGETDDWDFRSIAIFASTCNDESVSKQGIMDAIEGLSLDDSHITDPGFRLIEEVTQGDGKSTLLYAAYENADAINEVRIACYLSHDELVGEGVVSIGRLEDGQRQYERDRAENLLRNVKIDG